MIVCFLACRDRSTYGDCDQLRALLPAATTPEDFQSGRHSKGLFQQLPLVLVWQTSTGQKVYTPFGKAISVQRGIIFICWIIVTSSEGGISESLIISARK